VTICLRVSRDEIRHLLATPPVTEELLKLSVARPRLLAAENGTTEGLMLGSGHRSGDKILTSA
jgi:hypothetical protein